MNLAVIDWIIVAGVLLFMFAGVYMSKSLMRSVSDFLAAGRTAGKYIISLSQGMAMLGAITIIGMFEMNYVAGFTLRWWEFANTLVIVIITVTGWVIYRFRQTRALTMAQFFEMRYSKNFRVFAGILAFISGIINFGIFPSVGARFFISFCGLPDYFDLFGLQIGSFPLLMLILLGFALYFVFAGGQIAVIIADFIQGLFVNIVFIAIVIYFLIVFDWGQITTALQSAPADASLINPFNAGNVEDFNFWYFFIGMIGLIYTKLSWQGTQAYNSSAKSAHEAKMGEVLGTWRNIPQWSLFLVIVPVIAYTIFHNAEFSGIASSVQNSLNNIESETLQNQLRIPLVLTKILPTGLIGAFAAVMLAAFISTHDTYLHSWGSIFIQDVFLPFRKKELTNDEHIKVLRYSIIGVAIFIFFFSYLFQQSEYIFLFFAITGAIFTGGSGAVIIGGLYWKKGTTAAAWTAMITGAVVSVGGIILQQVYEDFPINGQTFWGLAMGLSTISYIVVSLLSGKKDFNMDKLLHRGKYKVEEEVEVKEKKPSRWRILGINKEFSKVDKLIYFATYAWGFMWTVIFVIGTIYNLTHDVVDSVWMDFWKFYIWIHLIIAVIVVIWFGIGGFKDMKDMFSRLKTMSRDEQDDGAIRNNNHD